MQQIIVRGQGLYDFAEVQGREVTEGGGGWGALFEERPHGVVRQFRDGLVVLPGEGGESMVKGVIDADRNGFHGCTIPWVRRGPRS